MKKSIIKKKLENQGYRVVELPDGKLIVKNKENKGKVIKNYNQAKARYLCTK